MTKNEIIEAINATIVTNGQKGITAESLANILLEMVNATPEGGSGAGVPYVYMGSMNMETGELSQTAEQKTHNAEVFQLVKASEVIPPINIDMSEFYEAVIGAPTQASTVPLAVVFAMPGMISGIEGEAVVLSTFDGGYILLADGTITLEPQIEE